MSHPDQLRQYARDCLRLSQDMTSPELKIHLINMAEAWAALASQSERIAALCATVPLIAVASGPLAPEGERPSGSDSSGADQNAADHSAADHNAADPRAANQAAVKSPALSPEPAEVRLSEVPVRRQPANDGGDEQDR